MSVSKQLHNTSKTLNVCLFALCGYEGIVYANLNARLLSSIVHVHSSVSIMVVMLAYAIQFLSSILLIIPIVRENRITRTIVHAVLSFSSFIELLISVIYNDVDGKLKSLFMLLTCMQNALTDASSRHLRIQSIAFVTQTPSTIERFANSYTSFVRTRSTRYKGSSLCIVLTILIVLYNIPNIITFLCESSLASQLAKIRIVRYAAIVAFLCAIGGEDKRSVPTKRL